MPRHDLEAIAKRNRSIVRLYRKGRSMRSIAAHHGVAFITVRRVIKEADEQKAARNLPGRKSLRNRIIAVEYRRGDTLRAVADRHGLNPSTVWAILRREGVCLTPEERRRRRSSGKGGNRPLVFESPEHKAIYVKARRIIGAEAAREQLGVRKAA